MSFKLGHLYNGERKNYIRFHDAYETAYSAILFACMSATLYLALPFIRLYTDGVTDIAYSDAWLPVLFASIQLLSGARATCTKLITVSGHAKNTIVNSVAEAVINLVVSIVLAMRIGIYGVLIGTIAALLYRSNDIIIYANRKILQRKPLRCYATHGVYFALFAVNVALSHMIELPIAGYGAFLVIGAAVAICMFALYGGAMVIMNRTLRRELGQKASAFISKVLSKG